MIDFMPVLVYKPTTHNAVLNLHLAFECLDMTFDMAFDIEEEVVLNSHHMRKCLNEINHIKTEKQKPRSSLLVTLLVSFILSSKNDTCFIVYFFLFSHQNSNVF